MAKIVNNEAIKIVGQRQKSIKIVGQRQKPVDLDIVAEALGAERTGIKIDTRRSPISLFGLRQFISNQLRSTGGRPSLIGTSNERNKIPLFDGDWEKLKLLSEYWKKKEGRNIAPAQIASIFLHQNLLRIDIDELSNALVKTGVNNESI